MNNEQRTMLELAAKACGHGVYFDDVSGLTFLDDKYTGILWSPQHNDRDCLRMARKLEINIDYSDKCAWKRTHKGVIQEYFDQKGCEGWWKTDREAVLAVAAQMGGVL